MSEDGSKEQSLLNEVGGETEEISAIQDCSVEATPIELSDVSFISNEDIPVLDKNLKTNISLNLRPDNTRAVSKNGGSPARKKAKNQFSNPSTKISNFKPSVKIRMDPITISSDEENENIPLIDDIHSKKTHVRTWCDFFFENLLMKCIVTTTELKMVAASK